MQLLTAVAYDEKLEIMLTCQKKLIEFNSYGPALGDIASLLAVRYLQFSIILLFFQLFSLNRLNVNSDDMTSESGKLLYTFVVSIQPSSCLET